MIKIEKNIPLPERLRTTDYPFALLEIGDSFFVPCDRTRIRAIRALIYKLQRREIGRKYQTQVNRNRDGIRVWRVI